MNSALAKSGAAKLQDELHQEFAFYTFNPVESVYRYLRYPLTLARKTNLWL